MSQDEVQSERRGLLRRLDQLSIGVVLGISLAIIGGYWWKKVGAAGGVIDVDRDVRFQVDVNAADWPELMVLPDIGETRARDIVAWRREHGRFETHDDLLSVPGIGEMTLAKIRPYLRPIPQTRHEFGT